MLDVLATHYSFTMTKMPADKRYCVLYEGTPGGQYDETDWWMTPDKAKCDGVAKESLPSRARSAVR